VILTQLSRAIRQHHKALARSGGVDVIYHVGVAAIELVALPLRADTESDDAEGETFSSRARDFGIAADELRLADGTKVEPTVGHTIDCEGESYIVATGGSPRCFETQDNLGILYRVHTIYQGKATE